jgi:hypothetical protein
LTWRSLAQQALQQICPQGAPQGSFATLEQIWQYIGGWVDEDWEAEASAFVAVGAFGFKDILSAASSRLAKCNAEREEEEEEEGAEKLLRWERQLSTIRRALLLPLGFEEMLSALSASSWRMIGTSPNADVVPLRIFSF